MIWNGVVYGLAAFFLAAWSALRPGQAWMAYGNGFVGIWVMMAPVAFWAPAAAYADATLAGELFLRFSVVVPMGMSMPGPDTPPGWTPNPASWPQRAPIVALALIGFFSGRYMWRLAHVLALRVRQRRLGRRQRPSRRRACSTSRSASGWRQAPCSSAALAAARWNSRWPARRSCPCP